jgi:hypothetical protein
MKLALQRIRFEERLHGSGCGQNIGSNMAVSLARRSLGSWDPLLRVRKTLLQLRVLGFGLLQDGNVGIGVFPEGQEILVCCACLDFVALHR